MPAMPWVEAIASALVERQDAPPPDAAAPPPAFPPMPEYSPEYLAYNNKAQILSITGVFYSLALFVVLVRCYVRVAMLKVFGIDDWIMVFAMILTTGTFVCFIEETKYGLGKHFMPMLMDMENYTIFAKILYFHSIIIMVAVSSVKISIAFFLLRLSTRTPYSRFLYGVIVFIICLTIACAMTLVFQCFPVEAAWDSSLKPPPMGTGTARCYSMDVFRNLGLMNSSFNIITDVLFATLPIPLIWKLQLNIRTKLSLIGVLSLGYFACAAAIVKAIQQYNVLDDPDWTTDDWFNIWNFIELTIGIVAASLPALKPLFNWFLEGVRAITSGGRTRKTNGYKGVSSLGYQKQSEASSRSIGLHSLGGSKNDTVKSPYNVQITGVADKEAWDMDHAKKSDDSILPLQQPGGAPAPRAGQQGFHGITVTREFNSVVN